MFSSNRPTEINVDKRGWFLVCEQHKLDCRILKLNGRKSFLYEIPEPVKNRKEKEKDHVAASQLAVTDLTPLLPGPCVL